MGSGKKVIALRYGQKVVNFEVILGEQFRFCVTSAVKLHFPEVKSFRLFLGSKPIPIDTKVAESHHAQEFTVKEERVLTVLTPFRQQTKWSFLTSDTVQAVFNFAASTFSVSTQHIRVSQSSQPLQPTDLIKTLPFDWVEISLTSLYPTVFVVNGSKVVKLYNCVPTLSIEAVRADFCGAMGVAADGVVLVMKGRRAVQVHTANIVTLIYVVRMQPGSITVIIQRGKENPPIGVDLNTSMTGAEAVKKIAGKLGKEESKIIVIFNGKRVGSGTVKESGMVHGSKIWVATLTEKKRITLKSYTGMKSIDVLPTDTIATVKSLYSKRAKIPAVQLTISHNGNPLTDEQIVPSACLDSCISLEVTIFPRVYIRKLSGKVDKLTLLSDITVEELRSRLVAARIIDRENCQLLIGKEELKAGTKVSEAGIKDKSILDADCM